MNSENDQPQHPAQQDEAATEPPAGREESPAERREQGDAERSGPWGNPRVDEEALRKRQEESSERSDDALG